MIVTCHYLGIPTFLATTFVHGMRSLIAKLWTFLKHIPEDKRAPIITTQRLRTSRANSYSSLQFSSL